MVGPMVRWSNTQTTGPSCRICKCSYLVVLDGWSDGPITKPQVPVPSNASTWHVLMSDGRADVVHGVRFHINVAIDGLFSRVM